MRSDWQSVGGLFHRVKTGAGGRFRWRRGVLVLLAVLPVVAWWRSGKATAGPVQLPDARAYPAVGVIRAERQDLFQTVSIPAEFRPYAEVELHAKVSGYLEQMAVDFGDKVKAGELLATLEVPELLDQLHNAIADRQRAEADFANAHLVYTRLESVDKDHPHLVAQQDLDTARAKDESAAAAIAAAKAEVERYQTLVAYTRITAPFDGVITRRYADPGALIQSGTASDTQAMPLVRVSDNYRLRLDFPVSVEYVKDVRVGVPVAVRVQSLGNRTFTGKITRFAGKVDEDTRTMPVEIEVTNSDLELLPGMYASVDLKIEQRAAALAIPIESVSSGARPRVRIVTAGDAIEERPVTLGLETPDKYEVLAGLKEGDLVVVGNPGQLRSGDKVTPKLLSLLAEP